MERYGRQSWRPEVAAKPKARFESDAEGEGFETGGKTDQDRDKGQTTDNSPNTGAEQQQAPVNTAGAIFIAHVVTDLSHFLSPVEPTKPTLERQLMVTKVVNETQRHFNPSYNSTLVVDPRGNV